MVEEGQHQPLKRIRFDEEDEDRISKLPDCLIVEILSRLPETKYAVRTGTLSKRWKHIWTRVHSLLFLYPFNSYIDPNPDYFSLVDKTLIQRGQLKLKKFRLSSVYNHSLESHIHNWIRYAVNCNVEDLDLTLRNAVYYTTFPLEQFVFISSSFTNLALSGCSFNPIGAISWKNLRTLRISEAKLDEDLIENILSGSPVLETLELFNCYGYRQLNITSKSVKNLVFAYIGHPDCDIVEINAPNILSLAIKGRFCLRKPFLLDVSSLVDAYLDYMMLAFEEYEERMLEGLILNLLHVKNLKIGPSCFKVLARLKVKGFIFPSNLKVLDVTP